MADPAPDDDRAPGSRPTAAEVAAYLDTLAHNETELFAEGTASEPSRSQANSSNLPLLPTLQLESSLVTSSHLTANSPAAAAGETQTTATTFGHRRLAAVLLPALLAGLLIGWLLASPSVGHAATKLHPMLSKSSVTTVPPTTKARADHEGSSDAVRDGGRPRASAHPR